MWQYCLPLLRLPQHAGIISDNVDNVLTAMGDDASGSQSLAKTDIISRNQHKVVINRAAST